MQKLGADAIPFKPPDLLLLPERRGIALRRDCCCRLLGATSIALVVAAA